MKLSVGDTKQPGPIGAWAPLGRSWPVLASIACAGGYLIFVEQARGLRGWLALVIAFGVGLVAVRHTSRVGRAMGWGAALVVFSLGPHGAHRGVEALAAVGAMVCAASASVAIARIPGAGGMAVRPPCSPVSAVIVITALWWAALVARFAPPDGSLSWMADHPRKWALGAAAASLLVLLSQTEWTIGRRNLELGIAERALALRAALATGLVAIGATGMLSSTDAAGAGALVIAASTSIAAAAALHPDAVRVARTTRRLVVLMIAGGGAALLGASAAESGGSAAWGATLVTAAVVMLIATLAPALEAGLRPARGAWLDALIRARGDSSRAEPEDAIREALFTLRGPSPFSASSAELWLCNPARVKTVDRAGYVHDRDAEMVEGLISVALREPEGTLCANILDVLEVRRPELRPLAKWMADRDALVATVILCEGDAEGILVLPRVGRDALPTLEEVRAVKDVADRLAAACRAIGMRDRMIARAYEATERAQRSEDHLALGSRERGLEVARSAHAIARLARPATVGVYSAVSRAALEALERHTTLGGAITVVASSGVDPVPYLARAHLAGGRADGPLVFVDAASAREHEIARWLSPLLSPLAFAAGGMLVLLDGAALPAGVQNLIARTIADRRAPWESPDALDVQLAFTSSLTPEQLVIQGRLEASLALRLATGATMSPILLPRLRDRADDLRAIITDCLAREGLRILGRPVGIDPAAYARLIEYPFPGDDAELAVIVRRIVPRCSGDIVHLADIDALRLTIQAQGPSRPGSRGQRKSPLSA